MQLTKILLEVWLAFNKQTRYCVWNFLQTCS